MDGPRTKVELFAALRRAPFTRADAFSDCEMKQVERVLGP